MQKLSLTLRRCRPDCVIFWFCSLFFTFLFANNDMFVVAGARCALHGARAYDPSRRPASRMRSPLATRDDDAPRSYARSPLAASRASASSYARVFTRGDGRRRRREFSPTRGTTARHRSTRGARRARERDARDGRAICGTIGSAREGRTRRGTRIIAFGATVGARTERIMTTTTTTRRARATTTTVTTRVSGRR